MSSKVVSLIVELVHIRHEESPRFKVGTLKAPIKSLFDQPGPNQDQWRNIKGTSQDHLRTISGANRWEDIDVRTREDNCEKPDKPELSSFYGRHIHHQRKFILAIRLSVGRTQRLAVKKTRLGFRANLLLAKLR